MIFQTHFNFSLIFCIKVIKSRKTIIQILYQIIIFVSHNPNVIIKIMLQNIVHNSNLLIKSQYLDEDSILSQLIKNKGKRRNLSYIQPSQKRSIFQQPYFNQTFDLKKFNKRNRSYLMAQTVKSRSKSQQASNKLKKIKPPINLKSIDRYDFNFTLADDLQDEITKSKIIHSRRNIQSLSSNKNPKIYRERVFGSKQKSNKKNDVIQDSGLNDLCFYKNSLQQIQVMRSARISIRKKNPQKTEKQIKSRNRINFVLKNNIMKSQRQQCRPWSPRNDHDVGQGDYICFKSLSLKI